MLVAEASMLTRIAVWSRVHACQERGRAAGPARVVPQAPDPVYSHLTRLPGYESGRLADVAAADRSAHHGFSPTCCVLSGYVLTSVEGRVAVEYFDNSPEVQAKRYAFKVRQAALRRQAMRGRGRDSFRCPKERGHVRLRSHSYGGFWWCCGGGRQCHRVQERVYPVNCVAFHPIHGTFATGGADGSVYTWDGENKKRVAQYTGYPTSIAAMDFNYDGSLLAIAASYTFEEGEKSHVPDEVYLRTPAEAEVRRKQR